MTFFVRRAGCLPLAVLGIVLCESCNQDPPAVTCTDGEVRLIQASSYNQTCKASSDCVLVGVGNACSACDITCVTAAINRNDLPRYQADLSKTPGAGHTTDCNCPGEGFPCCKDGACQMMFEMCK